MNLNYLFWEEISPEIFITTDTTVLTNEHSITFSRDDEYRLSCEITAALADRNFINRLREQGLLSFDIRSRYGQRLGRIEGVSFRSSTAGPKEAKINAIASKLILNYEINKSVSVKTIIYWFLSNIRDADIEFSRIFDYKTSGKVQLKIDGVVDDIIEMPGLQEAVGRTVMLLEFNGHKFCFGKVDEKYSGKNYKGIFLRFDGGYLPTDQELKVITDFLTFICGGIIVPAGYIKFGDKYSIIEQCYQTAYRKDIKQILNSPVMPAIPMDFGYFHNKRIDFNKIEEILTTLLKNYADNKDAFILDKIITYLKCARLSVFDVMLQPLFTALDLLQQIWFQGNKTKTHGKYLDDEEYNKILSNYLPGIENDLSACVDGKRIINKIKGANQYTLNDREKRFYDDIGLKIGKVEEAINKERNKTQHGTLGSPDYERQIALTYGAYALVNRTILKLLDYDGDYVDYSTCKFPYRPISEMLMGPENDGNL